MNPDAISLDHLHDIVMPPPVSWWPLASGWYWILVFVLFLFLVQLAKWFIHWQHNLYRREALAELSRRETELENPAHRAAALLELSELLKRTALTTFPREQVASLTGKEWFDFLDQTARTPVFCDGHGAMLESAIRDPRVAASLDEGKLRELVSIVRDWIAHHETAIRGVAP